MLHGCIESMNSMPQATARCICATAVIDVSVRVTVTGACILSVSGHTWAHTWARCESVGLSHTYIHTTTYAGEVRGRCPCSMPALDVTVD
jgi:hypothetical protein